MGSAQNDILNALGQGQVEQARYLLSNGCPLDLQRTVEVVIERGQCEALQFLINEYNIDVNKNFLLHRALFFKHEKIVNLLTELGADVNQCDMTNISKSMRRAVRQREDIGDCSVENIKFFLPLQLSLRCGVELMSFLLHSDANVNKQNGLQETTLMSACAESVDVQRVELLLQHGALTNLINLMAETALHLAAETGNTGKVQLLIDHGADIEATTNTQKTALMYACDRSVGVDCLTVLLQNGANINPRNLEGETALQLLAELGETEKLQVCIQYNGDVNATDDCDRTPLMTACASDIADVTCVRFLLEHNALPNITNTRGQSALDIAADQGHFEKLQVLVQYNSDRNFQTPLMAACASDTADITCVRFLLQNSALPNTPETCQTALHIAAKKGNLEKLQVLVQYNADVNAIDWNKQTPLMVACASDTVDVACVKFLLENHAFLSVQDYFGCTALHLSVRFNSVEKTQELLQYRAQRQVRRDDDSPMPFMLKCNTTIFEHTFSMSIDKLDCLNILTGNGKTALDLAQKAKNTEIIELLRQYGAKYGEEVKQGKASVNVENNQREVYEIVDTEDLMRKLQELAQYNIDMNTRDEHGHTLLMLACDSDTVDVGCVKFLLENKALPNKSDNRGQTALFIAAEKGNLEKLKVLVQYNANVNATNDDGLTPLMAACASDIADAACVRFLLENKALPNKTYNRGQTALFIAAEKGNLEKLKVLVQYNADVNATNDDGLTPLMAACASDIADAACVRCLLENQAFPGVQSRYGHTALHFSVKSNSVEKTHLLLQHRAQLQVQTDDDSPMPFILICNDTLISEHTFSMFIDKLGFLNIRTSNGKTALDLAQNVRNTEIIESLRASGAKYGEEVMQKKISLVEKNQGKVYRIVDREDLMRKLEELAQYNIDMNTRDWHGHTLLMLACASDTVDVGCVKFLLENKALPNLTYSTGQTALHFAVDKGNLEKVKVLVQYNADIHAGHYNYETPLIVACASDTADAACVRFLLRNNALSNMTGCRALHKAAGKGHLEKLQVLVQYNADVNARNGNNETPLIVACASDTADVACVRFLLRNNALPNMTDCRGQSALHKAAGKGHLEKLQVLVQYNADVNARNGNNKTPLMAACAGVTADVACMRFLLDNNALPNMTDRYGQSALHIAAGKGNLEKVEVLVQYNVDVNSRDHHGKTALILACERERADVECVTFLLANKALPDLHDKFSDTALDRAVERGHLEVARVLLQRGADVNVRSATDRKPVVVTVERGVETETGDLSKGPAVRGDTHLHRLIRTVAILRVIDAHKQYNVSLAEGGSVSILSRTLAGIGEFDREEVRAGITGRFDEDDLFRLSLARKCGSIRTSITSILKLFLESRADIEISTRNGESAYLLAARALDRPILELLCSHGANIFAVDSQGRNAIMLAVISTQYWMMLDERAVKGLECLQCLADQGVPVNHRDKAGRTPLMIAAYYENVDILRLLLSAGADVHAVRTERVGTAPLTGADVRTGTIEITALCNLLEKEIPDYGKNMDCIRELIRHGAVNSLPVRFNNLLHDLIKDKFDEREMIELLLTNGMAPTMSGSPPTNNSAFSLSGPYRSPLMVALHDGFVPVIKYLLENLMLCPCDISGHSYHKLWRDELTAQNEMEIVDIMNEFYSKPKSLFQLSFVQVSYALGGVPGRRERVRCLPVSEMVKERLLWKWIDIPMDFTRNV